MVTSRARIARAAAANGTLVRPKPWAITLPPTQAPRALPMLKAPIFRVDTRFGAALPKVTTLICSAGTAANDAVAQRNRVISVGITATLVQVRMVETTAIEIGRA